MTRSIWQFIAAVFALLIAVTLGHLLPGTGVSLVEIEFRDGLHLVGFACVAAVLFEVVPGGTIRKTLLTLVLGVSVGIVAEAVQSIVSTGFDPQDVMRDAVGVVVYLFARLCWLQTPKSRWLVFGLRSVAVMSVAALAVPVVMSTVTLASYAVRMPIVFEENVSDDRRLLWPINARIRLIGDSGHEFELGKRGWTGALVDTVVSDWTDYASIHVALSLSAEPSGPVKIHLSDGYEPGQRSQHWLGQQDVTAGDSEIAIDLVSQPEEDGRARMDLSSVVQIYVVVPNDKQGTTLRIARIWLE